MPTTAASDVRSHYPSLGRPGADVFLDNAGGSQVPGVVADAIHHYLTHDYAQTGADYATSRRASATVAAAHRFLKVFMNVPDAPGAPPGSRTGGEVIIGPSTSQLCATLANAYAEVLKPGDEVVFCQTGHESNIGPWARLEKRGIAVRQWAVDPRTGHASLDSLRALLGSGRVRLVAFPQVSNVLGEVIDLEPIVRLVHDAGARVVVDGVAFAPHRAIDVAGWNVDWYVYSTYKVFGPHQAVLYGTRDALDELTGPNHYFIPKDELPRKFELGGVNHECAAGILALDQFLRDFVGVPRLSSPADPNAPFDRGVVTTAFDAMEALETPLQARLIDFLLSKPGVRLIGPASTGRERVCIVSFVHASKPSRQIAQAGNARGLGFRFGNFYAYRLVQALGLDPADGVVRVSFAHYNTMEEAERLIAFLDEVL